MVEGEIEENQVSPKTNRVIVCDERKGKGSGRSRANVVQKGGEWQINILCCDYLDATCDN